MYARTWSSSACVSVFACAMCFVLLVNKTARASVFSLVKRSDRNPMHWWVKKSPMKSMRLRKV
jgi:hypothetical protein